MPLKFNPFTAQFDLTGSGGGGASYIDGEVAVYADLPLDGSAALNSAWLVRTASGVWPVSRKQAGIYIRTATGGSNRDNDYTYAGTMPDVFSDSQFLLYDNTDSSKNLAFDLGAIATGTTRTISVPDANVTLPNQDLSTTSFPTFGDLSVTGAFDAGSFVTGGTLNVQGGALFVDDGAPNVEFGVPLAFANGAETNSRTNLGLEIGTDVAAASHAHGNINSSGQVGSDSGRVLVTTTAGAVTTLALGTAGQVLTVNSGATGVEFAAASGGGVSAVNSTLADILSVSGSDLVADDLGSDKLYGWDDSAGKAIGFTIGSGLSVSGDTLSATASGGSKTYATFTATDNNPPATTFATIDQRNSIAVLDFDAATDENAVFVGIMPEAASLGSGLIVRLHWMATSATSGNVRWGVQFERSNTDLDADSFDTAVEATAAANGTSGILTTTAITVTTIDGITAGDVFRLKVFRNADDATNDTMTGDAELVAVEVRSAA